MGPNPQNSLFITPNGGLQAEFQKQPIRGDVDIIAHAVDPMNSAANMHVVANPHRIGYHITPLFEQGGVIAHGVRTAASPYVLATFDDNWFKGARGVPTSDRFDAVYDVSRPSTPFPGGFFRTEHFFVTNTFGTDGSIANVDAGQYWRTNAADDALPDDNAYANYAGKIPAFHNAMSRFKDGEYAITIVMGDLGGHQTSESRKVRVVNWERTAAVEPGGRAPDFQADPRLYDPAAPLYRAPYAPPFVDAPVIADTGTAFGLGAVVGVKGDQYYPDYRLGIYIVPHRPEGWREGDSLTSGLVRFIASKSDKAGELPLTAAWTADRLGEFDIVIDYDNDGQFSWRLDGLTGFRVAVGVVSGRVWLDFGDEFTANGIQDGREYGLPQVIVHLLNDAEQIVQTRLTGNYGEYSFQISLAGTYTLHFTNPMDNLRYTIQDAGDDDTIDSDVGRGTGRTDPFRVELGGFAFMDCGLIDPYSSTWESTPDAPPASPAAPSLAARSPFPGLEPTAPRPSPVADADAEWVARTPPAAPGVPLIERRRALESADWAFGGVPVG